MTFYDNSWLASGGDDCTARVWDVTTKTEIKTLHHGYHVFTVEFNHARTKLLTTVESDSIFVWDLVIEEPLCLGYPTRYRSLRGPRFSSDETRIICPWDDDSKFYDTCYDVPFGFVIYDTTSLERLVQVDDNVPGGPMYQMWSIAASPDDTFATGNQNGTISLWNAKTGALLLTIEGHSEIVTTVCYSSDGKRLFSAGYDKKI